MNILANNVCFGANGMAYSFGDEARSSRRDEDLAVCRSILDRYGYVAIPRSRIERISTNVAFTVQDLRYDTREQVVRVAKERLVKELAYHIADRAFMSHKMADDLTGSYEDYTVSVEVVLGVPGDTIRE